MIFGADVTNIWPQKLDNNDGMILYESLVTGNKLIQGASIIQSNAKLASISVANRILTFPSGAYEEDEIFGSNTTMLIKVFVFKHQGEIKTKNSNLEEEIFWKECSISDLVVTPIKACKSCLNCVHFI